MANTVRKVVAGVKGKRSILLTGGTMIGAGLSCYLTARGQHKADLIINQYEAQIENSGKELTWQDKLKLTWKCYIPAGGVLAATILGIGCNEYYNAKELAILGGSVGALAASKNQFEAAMRERYGDEAVDEIKMKIRQSLGIDGKDEVAKPGDKPKVIYQYVNAEPTGHGNQLFRDETCGRTFRSSLEHVKWAIDTFNMELLENDIATYNDLYSLWGIEETHYGINHGWLKGLNYDELEGVRFLIHEPIYDPKFGETIVYIDNLYDQPIDNIWGTD